MGKVIHVHGPFAMLQVGLICVTTRLDNIYACGDIEEILVLRKKVKAIAKEEDKKFCEALDHVEKLRNTRHDRVIKFLKAQPQWEEF